MNDTIYTGWYDPGKRPLQRRLEDAIDVFELRHGYRPAVVLVNEVQRAGVTAPEGVTVYGARRVARDTFYLAHERQVYTPAHQARLVGLEVR